MRYCKYILLTISVVLGLFACQKDEDVTIAQLNIKNEVITPSYTSADIECWIECNVKFNQAKVECALTQDFQSPIVVAMEQSKGKYVAQVVDLQYDTTYYVRYIISNRMSAMTYDKIKSFKTLKPSVPTVQLDSVANIWDVTANACAQIIKDGGLPVTEWGICLKVSTGADSLFMKADSQSLSQQIVCAGLQPNTTYRVRAYAKNAVGTGYSEERTFTTYALPTVETKDVSNIKLTTALLSGMLVFNGNDSATVKGFCWGLKTNPTIDGNQVVVDTVGNAYTYLLSNLKDETKYYVRAYARNKIGVAYGEEKTFTTQAAVVPVVSTTAASSITSVSAKVGGNVTADGGAEVTERGICYSTTKNPTTASTKLASGKGMGSYVCDLTGLQANTTYYVRAYAINKKGTAYGEEVTFTTNKNIVPPTVTTSAVTQITETSAVAGGNVTADGNATVTERGVVYSTTANPTTANTKKVSGSGTGAFTCNLTGLQASTTYYVRAYAINEKGTAYGEQVTFKTLTPIVPPTVTTSAVTQITETTAVAGGNVTSDGGASVTERGVVYSTTANPTTANTKKVSGSGTGAFTCNLTGLQASTTYYVRAYAINEKGTSYGEQVTFKTLTPIVPPTVTTSAVTQITETTAVAGGNVTSDGGASVTERGVVYSTSQNPTTSSSKVTAGSGTGSYTSNLTGLQASTTYYVRAYAINEKGTAYGEQVSFTTLEEVSATPEYVDLGLSVKWADRNVGASKPEEYGDYFAWGETQPKSTYDWSTYKWCNGSETTLTKYCTDGSYGTVDNKTQLELSDDAARANWGGNWRMPTDTEFTELREQCTWTWTTQNGVYGYKVTSKSNGNSIFLPAAGYRYGSGLPATGSNAYWSSSLGSGYPNKAYYLYFDSSLVDCYNSDRNGGFSVRPVYGPASTMPTVTTSAVTQITETTAVAGGNVTSDGGASVTERGVVYSTSENPTTANSKVVGGSGTGAFTCNLTGLQASTTYYVRAYAINSKGTNYGAQVTFTTSNTVVLPTVTTTSASQTGSTTATVSGSVLDDGGATITERGVVYATYSNPTTASSKVINGSGTGAFSCNLTGLQSNTTYYVRAYAINSKGTAYGDQVGLTMTTSTGNVSYELNGGVTNDYGWQSKNDMFQACMADCGVTGLPTLDELKATGNNAALNTICTKLTDVTGMLTTERWDWLEAYIMQVQNADATAIALVEGTTSPAWRYAVAAFFLESQRTGWPKTADYTQAGKVEAFMPYWKHGFANPTEPTAEWVLSAPYRQGYAFDGWYWNSSFSGSKVTTVSASSSGTLYAKWVVATSINLPVITTSTITQITETTAVAGGNVTSDGGASVTERGVVYSTSQNPTTANTKKVSGSGTGAFTCNLTGLQASTTYYVRAYAINEKGTSYGEQVTFKTLTPIVPPTVTTSAVTQITETTAVAGGNVTADGGASVTERGVVYSTTANPTTANTKKVSGSGTGAFTCNLTGLQASTTYYVRAYAINEKGTAYGEQVTFKTLTPIVPPTVTTSAVTQITETTAVAGGNVTADGGASVTERGVVYSTTANPTTANTKKVSGSGTGAFTCNMSGLLAGTTYYVRAYAINEKGTSYGEEVSFVTKNLSSSIYVPTNEELWEIFKPYYNTYYDLWRADQPIGKVSTFAGSKMLEIMTDSESGFKWLGDYIMQVSAEQGYSLDTEISWRWAVHSFFNCNQQNNYPFSADFTIAGQPAAWGAAYQAAYNEGRTVTIILETSSVTEYTETTAVVDCEIIYSSDMTITERGVVYGTIQKPTVSNSKVTSGSGTGSFTCNLTGLQAGTMYYVRSYAINEKGIAYGRQVTFKTLEEVSATPEYVDLGLSVKWATFNVGASKPEEYGDYFAWGETEPKSSYSWSTYKWCNGSKITLTKYCTVDSLGIVDNKTQLELSDDAARANWGGNWRMPTDTEFTELREQCTWTWTTQNGVNGYKVTSKSNGNSIFLPATGCRIASSLYYAGIDGSYWSSSLGTDNPDNAWRVRFYSDDVSRYDSNRYYGFSVRPVCQ